MRQVQRPQPAPAARRADPCPRPHPGRQVRRRSQLLRHHEGAGVEAAPWSGSKVMAHLTIRLVTKQGRRTARVWRLSENGVGGMALDPESQRLIDLMAAANRPAWNTLSPQAARELYLSLRPAPRVRGRPRPRWSIAPFPALPATSRCASIGRPRRRPTPSCRAWSMPMAAAGCSAISTATTCSAPSSRWRPASWSSPSTTGWRRKRASPAPSTMSWPA